MTARNPVRIPSSNAGDAGAPSRRRHRLAMRLAAASVVTASLLGAMAGGASAGPPLAPAQEYTNQATIKQTGIDVHGTWARLEWTANVASTVVEISTTPPKQVNGKWVFDAGASSATVPKVNGAFAYNATLLNPATTYHVILPTPATNSLASTQATGQFTTKARTLVTVTFDKIHVFDDGDPGAKGKGDLWWYFDTSVSEFTDGWHHQASSGETFDVNYNGTGPLTTGGNTAGSSVTVTLQGREDDVDGWDFGCGLFEKWPYSEPAQYEHDCGVAAFAQTTVTFPTYIGENNPQPFTAEIRSRAPILFKVTGTVQASYA